jgi:hypothetical protein
MVLNAVPVALQQLNHVMDTCPTAWRGWPKLLSLLLPQRIPDLLRISSALLKDASTNSEVASQALCAAADAMRVMQAAAMAFSGGIRSPAATCSDGTPPDPVLIQISKILVMPETFFVLQSGIKWARQHRARLGDCPAVRNTLETLPDCWTLCLPHCFDSTSAPTLGVATSAVQRAAVQWFFGCMAIVRAGGWTPGLDDRFHRCGLDLSMLLMYRHVTARWAMYLACCCSCTMHHAPDYLECQFSYKCELFEGRP